MNFILIYFNQTNMTQRLAFLPRQIRKNPYLLILGSAVSLGLGGLVYIGYHKLRNDPTLILGNRTKNPYPWIHVRQNENLKLYAVNNKFSEYEDTPRKTFILNDRPGI